MVIIAIIEGLYMIGHLSAQNAAASICVFQKEFFPEKLWRRIRSLPVFSNSDNSFYRLDTWENREIAGIFRKINDEKNSGYVFSEDLQRTYIIELIHFISKVHQKTPPFIQTTLN